MPRHCPECKGQMQDDGIHCWCPWSPCTFTGYRVLRTGKILPPEPDDEAALTPNTAQEDSK